MGDWQLSGYTEIERLGEGGFGRVVLARHDDSGTFVAIKYLYERYLADELYLSRFRQEAYLLQRVSSPHVVRLYQFAETPQGAAIVMEAVPGVSLRSVLRADGVLAPEAALAVLKGSLLGLAAAHEAGVAHRDYKPDNVLVGGQRESKLVDFGLAVLDGQAGLAAGTPAYMAPEQWAGQPGTPATDVYAATCVFFQCVTGRKPYRAEDPQALRNLHEYAPIPFGEVPEAVRGLVVRGMAKELAARPAGARAFVAELESAAAAAYGQDWEDRGLRRLAERAATLVALSPLALLGTASVLAPAGAGGVAASVPVAAGPVGKGVLGSVGAKVATIGVGAAVLVGGAVIAVTTIGAEETPAAAPPPAVLVAVQTRSETSSDPGFDLNAKYVAVSGYPDPATDGKINALLMAPVDDYADQVRDQLRATPPEGTAEMPHLTSEVRIRAHTPDFLSVRYDFTLDSDFLWHSSWKQSEIVNIDLKAASGLSPKEVLAASTLTDTGTALLVDRLHEVNGGELCPGYGDSVTDRGNITTRALTGEQGKRPGVQLAFGPDGADVVISQFELGYPTGCGVTRTITLPYEQVTDLLAPEMAARLPSVRTLPRPTPGSPSPAAPPAASPSVSPSAGVPAPGGDPLSVGRLTIGVPFGWTVQDQGLERVVVNGADCPDPQRYSNCAYFLVTDNARANAEQPSYEPGRPYRRSANGRACNAAGRKDLWQEGTATKVESGLASVGAVEAVYEKWTVACVPKGSGETSGPVSVTQRLWFLPKSQVVVVDEWGSPEVDRMLAEGTVG
ncbi:serine/threonine protein kinase [Amycolatopsis antarctica]|uniref:Serine/threonine protein kinase n=1 Tax=Amycolatopsis antarctica TaxID=1854586 RepID=A0A263D2X6_9PSEU|nr:serine/threonine-protein kinase [Amycolatopsis antarctica]OZM72559.1 serine/threonine protein kinase [Amycolatopsis antarctica]